MRPTLRCLNSLGLAADRSRTIGFIGLGQMGWNMSANLLSKQFAEPTPPGQGRSCYIVCDANVERAASFVERFKNVAPGVSVEVAENPGKLAQASRVIVTMLPSSPQVKQVYGGASGIIPALRTLHKDDAESTICIDATTLDINVAKEVANDVKSTLAEMVDAPVSGGVTGAEAGTLSFLVGGTPEAFERASKFIVHMGQRVIHCGSFGSGLAAKICNNMVLGVEQIVVAEAMLLGKNLGLDPQVLAQVINSSTGGCWASSVNNPVPGSLPGKSPPSERDYEGGFQTALMLKDMGLAIDSGTSTETPLPLGQAAQHIYKDVVTRHAELATKDFSSVYRYLERAAADKRPVPTG
ncbi:hypothetical protein CALVIDRAFT_547738 [Calocera viscosa TUFC12733]|uniref:3-hydroxyisobutyrate dehydrogenase n=1 Tax=Calocera viscosa (strain TUFC12733) TaxID=1330018 RepID=A0A167FRU2_CALVF|nr:hypothetical protein CALVIDRAFT_547738 [Calocera viscosa TUFC12733]